MPESENVVSGSDHIPIPSPHSPPILWSYEQFAAAMLPWLVCRPSIRGLDVSVVRCDDFRELLNEPSNIMELILRKPPVLEEAPACQLLDGMMTAFPFLHNSDSRHRCGAEPCAANTQLLFLPPSLPPSLSLDRCRSCESGLHVTPWVGEERGNTGNFSLYTVCEILWRKARVKVAKFPSLNSIRRACKSVINEIL